MARWLPAQKAARASVGGSKDLQLSPVRASTGTTPTEVAVSVSLGESCSSQQLESIGISALQLKKNVGFFKFQIKFECTERHTYVFTDAAGDSYSCNCLRKGTHDITYDSKQPRIVKVSWL